MNIDKIIKILIDGGIVILPTDTIYGISCDALNVNAVRKIYELKNREYNKPMIILVSNKEMLRKYCIIENIIEEKIIDEFMPGKLTIILGKKKNIPNIVTANMNTVGVRIPSDKNLIKIIKKLGRPIVSTSCNISGGDFITDLNELEEKIKYSVNYMENVGKLDNKTSTIVRVCDGDILVLRNGDIDANAIKNIII